ncbi:hypothetical protein [Neobacillus sp. LXY-1]|uniref:hypothetical protein n=1 Tax=Neobacillus sp. LXY-1 TaxID=3379133 RepID=UPI003EE06A87
MSNLSGKELLEKMAEFPKHELTTKQRTEMLKKITVAKRPKKLINLQRIGALAAVLLLAFIGPLLYFSYSEQDPSQNLGASPIKEIQADYFALVDQEGKPLYIDSNFGIPNKVSLLAPKEWVARDNRSLAKIMIFLWGKDIQQNQILNIDAVNVKTGAKLHLDNAELGAGMYGADAHALASFKQLDSPGIWNLIFTVYNSSGKKKQVGEFSIYVKKPYITIGNSTLLISEEDIYAGFYEDVYLEVEGDHLPNEIQLEVFQLETAEPETFSFKEKTDFTTTEGKKISMYKGNFQIKKSGKYRFTVLNQSQSVDVGRPIDENK